MKRAVFVLAATACFSLNAADVTEAYAELKPTQGNQATGHVSFKKVDKGVLVEAEITGLTPGEHGFHIHEFGDCSAPDAMSAGGHYNPYNKLHDGDSTSDRHMGDLGNIVADAEGKASYSRVDNLVELNGEHTIIGRSVVVHADRDDLKTQPTGNAGARVACGVIEERLQE